VSPAKSNPSTRVIGQGFEPGSLTIIGARPSVGKTTVQANLALAAAQQGKGVAFISLEEPDIKIAQRLVGMLANVPWKKLEEGRATERETERLRAAALELESSSIVIAGDNVVDIDAVEAQIIRAHHMHRLDLVVVDYLQLLSASSQRGRTRADEVNECVQRFKVLAKRHDFAVIVSAQLNRQVESRDKGKPRLADLRDSGGIEAAADICLLLHRDAYQRRDEPDDGHLEIIVGKNRHGRCGAVHTHLDLATGRISDWPTYKEGKR
jgi:replicative DNA helicase